MAWLWWGCFAVTGLGVLFVAGWLDTRVGADANQGTAEPIERACPNKPAARGPCGEDGQATPETPQPQRTLDERGDGVR